MIESKLPGCVWRGDEGDGSSFHCFHASVSKTIRPSDCAACRLRLEAHLPCENPIEEASPPTELAEVAVEEPSLVGKIAHGITGLTKAALGIDHPGDEVVKQRWDICKSCEHFRLWQCRLCGCLVSGKIRLASERCPILRWNAVEPGK